MNKKKIYCLVTGYPDLQAASGGTLCLLTILERLYRDGFDTAYLCLTNKSLDNREALAGLLSRGGKIEEKSNDRITFRLKEFSFPFILYFTDIDMGQVYNNYSRDGFNRLAKLWKNILRNEKIDAAITNNADVFSMRASSDSVPVRFHWTSDLQIFADRFRPYADFFREIIPRFNFLCVSDYLNNRIKKHYGQGGMTLVPILDFEALGPAASRGEFITMINNDPGKGLVIFLNIARNLPENKFLLVTNPHVTMNLNGLNLPNITLVPWGPDVSGIYHKTRILLVPSLWEETYARVIIEGLHFGLPIIANDVGGMQEALRGAGFSVKVNEAKNQEPDFYTNIKYHANSVGKYLEIIEFLDQPENYQNSVGTARKAAARAYADQEEKYRVFKEGFFEMLINTDGDGHAK